MSNEVDQVVGWAAASEATGLTVATLRKLVNTDKLTCSRDDKGRYVFAMTELEGHAVTCPAQDDGEAKEGSPSGQQLGPGALAARVFELLERGEPLPAIVIQLQIEPETALTLHAQWRRLRTVADAGPVAGPDPARDSTLALLAQTVDALVHATNRLRDYPGIKPQALACERCDGVGALVFDVQCRSCGATWKVS